MTQFLPNVKKSDLEKNSGNNWDFLFVLYDKYFPVLENSEIVENFSSYQHTFMAFNYLDAQVSNGGFIQLIQNGYGEYIFLSPFSTEIAEFGLVKTAEILEEVKKFYLENKEDLESEKDIEEFSKLYEKFKEFEKCDDKYFEISESELEIFKNFVEKNIEYFAKIED